MKFNETDDVVILPNVVAAVVVIGRIVAARMKICEMSL